MIAATVAPTYMDVDVFSPITKNRYLLKRRNFFAIAMLTPYMTHSHANCTINTGCSEMEINVDWENIFMYPTHL